MPRIDASAVRMRSGYASCARKISVSVTVIAPPMRVAICANGISSSGSRQ